MIVGVTGGTSTPIEDLRDVTERILDPRRHARGERQRRASWPKPPSSARRRPPAGPRPCRRTARATVQTGAA